VTLSAQIIGDKVLVDGAKFAEFLSGTFFLGARIPEVTPRDGEDEQ
jgi:hypothetical protein